MKRRGSLPGPRPHLWKSGPDHQHHDQYVAWHRARAQAHYRGEVWQFTFEEYQQFWGADWSRRGRDSDSLSMSRHNRSLPWSPANCFLATRAELNRLEVPYRRRKRTRAQILQDQKADK